MQKTEYIREIKLDDKRIIKRSAEIEAERNKAIEDLLLDNQFNPTAIHQGPYDILLTLIDGRIKFMISSDSIVNNYGITLAITPFRGIIKDYFLICESYFDAVKSSNTYRVEAIDMGRRGIHNEGAELLKTLLSDNIEMDLDTARRLFTLVCVLHL